MSATAPVLIVGGGPAGLVLALSLVRNGVPVRIVEKSLTAHGGTRGAGVMPRSLELLSSLGVLPEISRLRGLDAPFLNLYKLPGGTEVLKTMPPMMEAIEKEPSIPLNRMWFVSQAVLEGILRGELEKNNCPVEFGKELKAFEQDDQGIWADVLVHHSDGDETTERVPASFLVGADGGKGIVRKLLKLDLLGSTMDADGMLVANAVVNNLSTEVGHVWKETDGLFFHFRPYDPKARKFVISILGANTDLKSKASPDGIKDLLVSHIGRDDIDITEYEWLSYFQPNMRVVNTFSAGKVFLAGDAAHVHSPHGGQGLNSSIQDSFNLGWKLALVHKGLSPASLLGTYNEERLPVIAEMLKQVTGLYTKFQSDVTAGLSRGKELLMLGINYRWSSLVIDQLSDDRQNLTVEELKAHPYSGWNEGLRAGDRAPDAPGLLVIAGRASDTPTTLFDIFTPNRHTVILFTDPTFASVTGLAGMIAALDDFPSKTINIVIVSQSPRDELRSSPPSAQDIVVAIDQGGHAFKAYITGYDGHALFSSGMLGVVVRPDGVVGGFVTDGDGLEVYRSKIFK